MGGLDIFNIRRRVSGRRETEMIDLDALVDRTLTGRENMTNIERQLGMFGEFTQERHQGMNPTSRRQQRQDTRGAFYQVGQSNEELDRHLPALEPGFRRTDWGTSYTERRKNRSDRPGRRT